ncbi:hypothetical protein Y1Q_0006358 [Alligator mississippiensis]|uniref:Uncharacterized protein n=1 Tax=Alligator mississippiensis TaxID=8496 RepID=A0A151NYC7_ALLMI|nr:hypothetical protein Y1Q_0006358 [Alligator mississippiensis]
MPGDGVCRGETAQQCPQALAKVTSPAIWTSLRPFSAAERVAEILVMKSCYLLTPHPREHSWEEAEQQTAS